jgi:ABC-type transport system involved in multi-copper enzyme maturation permease subunit
VFREVFLFECRQQARSPLFVIVALSFAAFAFFGMASENVSIGGGTDNLYLNATFAIVQTHAVLGIISMFAAVAFVATPLTRDRELRTEEMFVATGVSPCTFFFGRFCGGFLFAAGVSLAAVLGTLVATFMPWLDSERIQPFTAAPYVFSLFAVMLPTLFVVSSFVAVAAALTRSLVASYVTLVALFVCWIVAQANTDAETIRTTALLDPFGSIPIDEATRYWTAFEKNTEVPVIAGSIVANRLVWLPLSALALAIGALRFRFGEIRQRRMRGARTGTRAAALPSEFVCTAPTFDHSLAFAQFASQLRMDIRGVIRTYPFWVLLGLALMNVTFIFYGAISQLFGTPVLPVTRMMLQLIASGYLFMAVIVVVYYAGELVHRERMTRVSDYVDAMPFPNWVMFCSKLAALAFVVAAMLLVSMIAAMIVQALHGYTQFEVPVYLVGVFLVMGGLPFLLCVPAIALQAIVGNRFVGMLAMVLLFFALNALDSLGFEHPLYQLGLPEAPLSDMNGWGHFVAPLLTVGGYWAALLVLVGIAGHLFVRRGVVGGWTERMRIARVRFARPVAATAVVSLVAAAALGGWIYYNTNVLNTYETADDLDRLKAEYEKRYKPLESLPMPEAVDLAVEVDIHPDERSIATRGTALVENVHAVPLEEIHVTTPRMLDVDMLTIEGAELVAEDAELGYRKYRLATPLPPGGRTTVVWATAWRNPGFVHARSSTRVVANGTFVDSTEIFPSFGYAAGEELVDNNKRRKHDLPPARRLPRYEDAGELAPSQATVRTRTRFRAPVSTAADQIAVAPGYLKRDWVDGDRRYFEYEMDAPIWPFASFSSARYAVERGRWNDVAIEVYYHPPHAFNVRRMIEATQKSLDYFTREFSPYQYRQFRILEFPGYQRFAQSFPNTIPYSEAIGFVADLSDPKDIDYVFYVTAHELAHQWWGHQVMGRYAQGMTLLVETLAQYSALMVMEREYGPQLMRRFLRYELDNYLSNRGAELIEELPLALVENQPYVHYRKGSLAMYALKEAIGEEAVNRALREVLARYAFRSTPFPRSRDLIDAFRAVAGPAHDTLITDLFEKIVVWDLAVTDARAERLADGRTRVIADIRAAKFEADGAGRETEVGLDEVVEVGVYPEAGDELGENDLPEPLAMQRARLRPGTNTIEFVVAEAPAAVVVDPKSLRIDRNPDDNTRTIATRALRASML